MQWCEDGPSTYNLRMQLFEDRKKAVEEEIEQLQKTLAILKFKCWYYKKAMEDGREDSVRDMMPDRLPPEIQEYYNKGFR